DLRLPHGFARLGSLPQREVAGVVLLVFVHIDARAVGHAREVLLRQLAVFGKLGDAEVIRAVVGLIGITLIAQYGDEMRHLLNVLGRLRQQLGMLNVQGVGIFEKRVGVLLGVLLHGD